MRKTLFVLLLLAATAFTIKCQVPEKFNYQATIRNSSGELLVSKDIKVKISILKSDIMGQSVYTETHAVKTTDKGIITLHIGAGNSSDDLVMVDWYNGPYFMKVEVDAEGGDDFVELGTSEILSVPYAIAAGKAGSVEWNQIENKPSGVTGSYMDLSDKPVIPTLLSDLTNDAGFINTAELPLSLSDNSVSIQKATSSQNGYLSSADWNIFNNKISSQWNYSGNNIYYNEGHVGIGTNNPSYRLNVVSTSSDYDNESRNIVLIQNLSASNSAFAGLGIRADDNSHGVNLSFTSSNYSLIEDMKSSASLGTNGNAIAISTTSPNGSIRFLSNPYQSGLIEMMRLDVNGNLGLGTKNPTAKFEIADGDIYIKDIDKGIIMTSPDGQCWKGTINNSGILEFASIPCP
jgi:hypothetical protein